MENIKYAIIKDNEVINLIIGTDVKPIYPLPHDEVVEANGLQIGDYLYEGKWHNPVYLTVYRVENEQLQEQTYREKQHIKKKEGTEIKDGWRVFCTREAALKYYNIDEQINE